MADLVGKIELFSGQSLTQLGLKAVEAFLSLPAAKYWNPPQFMGRQVDQIFQIGLPLALVNDSQNTIQHARILDDELAGKSSLTATSYLSAIAELHACSFLNAQRIPARFVTTTQDKTPDLRATSAGAVVDIEVVRASLKSTHEELRARLQEFSGAIQPGDVGCNFIFFFADANNLEHLTQAFEQALTLKQNETATDGNNWSASAFPAGVSDDFQAQQTNAIPSWWPSFTASFGVNSVLVGAVPHYVQVKALPSRAEYINPVKRKAERFQGSKGVPFVIALEAEELPNVFQQIGGEVAEYWSQWDHVSGILVFMPLYWTVSPYKSYRWKFLRNPHATTPLPQIFLEVKDTAEQIDLYVLR